MSEDRTPDASGQEEPAESVPMNRAERRAKGKKSAQQTHFNGKQKSNVPKGPQGHGQRLWNRKSG
ncbi:hypothetical protein [Allorhizocola rhizosphaerae]|uniref:hypothetical protein n=1 Tax=Allorhizocola rhizosphaerae TaxID=1872709 RepID=UPI0013C34706|nr:hypothetical protein [Allorhizocola rhizosphaerae]